MLYSLELIVLEGLVRKVSHQKQLRATGVEKKQNVLFIGDVMLHGQNGVTLVSHCFTCMRQDCFYCCTQVSLHCFSHGIYHARIT